MRCNVPQMRSLFCRDQWGLVELIIYSSYMSSFLLRRRQVPLQDAACLWQIWPRRA